MIPALVGVAMAAGENAAPNAGESSNGLEAKSRGGSMHGQKMAVSYNVLKNGRHILVVKEAIGHVGKKAQFKELATIDLDLKDGEMFAPYDGFRCSTNKGKFVYGVIPKGASHEIMVVPRAAWLPDEEAIKLVPVEKTGTVECRYEPEGEV